MKHTTLLVTMSVAFVGTAALAWIPGGDQYQGTASEAVAYFGVPATNVDETLAVTRTIAEMTIQHYDADQAILHNFQVVNQNGNWTIPSHHNYPADGGDQVGRTAGSVLG